MRAIQNPGHRAKEVASSKQSHRDEKVERTAHRTLVMGTILVDYRLDDGE